MDPVNYKDPYDGAKPGMSQDKYLGFWTGASLFAIVVTICLLILDWAGLIG